MQNPVLNQMDLVEQQFNQVAAFLACGEAPNVETASAALQTLSQQLARLLQSPPANPAARKVLLGRVSELARGMQVVRDNLSRQAALNQQTLNVLVPTPVKSTYSGGSSVYGSVARQAGVQRFLAA